MKSVFAMRIAAFGQATSFQKIAGTRKVAYFYAGLSSSPAKCQRPAETLKRKFKIISIESDIRTAVE
jgi:hypothetical protein